MSALDDLKDRIDSAIYTNTEQNITGDGLQTVLDDMVDTMGVSVSQNTQTGHTDITIGSTSTPVVSVEEISGAWIANKYINGDTGEEVDGSNYYCTNFLPIYDSIKVYGYDAGDNTGIFILNFYDKDKNFISSYRGSSAAAFLSVSISKENMPSNAVFFRANSYVDIIDSSYAISKYADTQTLLYDILNNKYGTRINNIENRLNVNKSISIIDDATEHKYIAYADGTETSFQGGLISDYIEVEYGDSIIYALTSLGDIVAYIACYDTQHNYLQSVSVRGIGTGGVYAQNSGSFVIPQGVAYIKISSSADYIQNDSCFLVKQTTVKDYINDNCIYNSWVGKKWCAFGTSITDTQYNDVHFLQPTGKYLPFLRDLLGVLATDKGIAGGSFKTDILNKVLTTQLSAYDLVTIEGAVNDWATDKPIGQIGDKTSDTFAGCIYLMAKYVYENSNATLVFITDHIGRYVAMEAPDGTMFYGDCAPDKQNNLGLLQIDYINMIINQCAFWGLPCIKAGQESEISAITGDLYLMDHIHQSYIGGKQYAQTIYTEMLKIRPRIISLPNP